MKPSKEKGPFANSSALSDTQELLRALFNLPTVGLAVFDNQLRFRAVNKSFAAMDGIAPEAHLGKTIRKVLGKAAIRLEPPLRVRKVLGKAAMKLEAPLRYVLSSGQDVMNFQFSAKHPNRKDVGYGTMNCFAVRGASGITQVGMVVLPTTEQMRLQQGLLSVIENLFRNLLLSAGHSHAPLAQIMQGPLKKISNSEAKRHRSTVGSANQEKSEVSVPLTPREQEIIKFLAEGHGNKGTAAILGISVKTVETHRARIMLKLGLHTTTDLLHYAINNKILDLADMSTRVRPSNPT